MKKGMRFLLFIAASMAQAGAFSGYWTGTGTVTVADIFTGNKTSPCSKIELFLEQSPTQMIIRRYRATCELMSPDWGPRPFEIQETKVFEEEEEIGTFENDLFKTLTRSGSVAKAFNMRLNPAVETDETSVPTLDTYYGVKNLLGAIVIEGQLTSAPAPEEF